MNKIDVLFQSYDEIVGCDEREYTENPDGSINLVGKLFGVINTHIPKEDIDFENGIPVQTMVCIHDGRSNRLYHN